MVLKQWTQIRTLSIMIRSSYGPCKLGDSCLSLMASLCLLDEGCRNTNWDKHCASTNLFMRIKLALQQEDLLDNSLTSTQVQTSFNLKGENSLK